MQPSVMGCSDPLEIAVVSNSDLQPGYLPLTDSHQTIDGLQCLPNRYLNILAEFLSQHTWSSEKKICRYHPLITISYPYASLEALAKKHRVLTHPVKGRP